MPGTVIDINKAGITTLVEYAKQSAFAKDDEILSLKEECITVKHGLQIFNSIVDTRITALKAETDKAKQQELLLNLCDIQDAIRKAVLEVSRVVKTAAEIEAIKATRFDALQLLQLVNQIPSILTDVLIEILSDVFQTMVDDLATSNVNGLISEQIEVRELRINELVQHIATTLNQKLEGMQVVYNKDTFGETASDAAVDASMIRRQVQAMYDTVPAGPAGADVK